MYLIYLRRLLRNIGGNAGTINANRPINISPDGTNFQNANMPISEFLEQYFFECIRLSLPIQRIHPDNLAGNSGCNSEMLSILNKHNSSFEEKKEIDPRRDKLKDLLNN